MRLFPGTFNFGSIGSTCIASPWPWTGTTSQKGHEEQALDRDRSIMYILGECSYRRAEEEEEEEEIQRRSSACSQSPSRRGRKRFDVIPVRALNTPPRRRRKMCNVGRVLVLKTRVSDKISHIDMEGDHIDTVISHIISPYPTSKSRTTISTWWMPISTYHIQNRLTMFHIDNPIDNSLTSDLPYRSSISISHLDIGSYLVTLNNPPA